MNVKKMDVTSFGIGQIKPLGLRSVSLTANVGLDNNSSGFSVYDIEGVVKRNGNEFGTFSAEPVTVRRKSSEIHELKGIANLSPSIPAFEIMSLMSSKSLEEFTVSLSCKVKPKGGIAKKVKFEDVPAKVILDRFKKQQKWM